MDAQAMQTVSAIAAAVWLVVRWLKDDLPPRVVAIPPAWRPVLALVLGQVASGLEAYARGTPPLRAVVQGLVASAVAMSAHDLWAPLAPRLFGDGTIARQIVDEMQRQRREAAACDCERVDGEHADGCPRDGRGGAL